MRLRVLLEPHHGASYDQILALARVTEESGFDAFFRSDHYQGIDPDDSGYRPTDSWTTLAGLAVQTERVRLGTLMTASTYRRPGPLAITVATVDAMSGGRAELGIGAAWIEQEHRYLGIPFPPLGERFDRLGEQLEIITGLWATPPGERFSFQGKHYQLEECASIPRPARRPPVIIGGAGPRRTPALAARFADEFNSGMPDGLAARFANFRRICEQSGRDPAGVRLSTTLPVCCGPTRAEAARRAAALGEAGARMLALVFRLIPKVGPFKAIAFKVPNPDTENLYLKSVNNTVEQYRTYLKQLAARDVTLQNRDFDTGKPTKAGEYELTDQAYAKLLDKLAEHKFANVTPALRENILQFYAQAIDVGLGLADFSFLLGQTVFDGFDAAPAQIEPLGMAMVPISFSNHIGQSCGFVLVFAKDTDFNEAGIANRPQIHLLL